MINPLAIFRRSGTAVGAAAINVLFGVLKVAALLWVVRLAGRYLASEPLGEFLVGRRLAFTVASFLQLGLSQTMLRQLPMSRSGAERRSWVQFSLVVWFVLAVILIPIAYAAREPLTPLFFGEGNGTPDLAFWTGMLAVGGIVHYYAVSTLFAMARVALSNVVDMINSAVVMLAVVLVLRAATTPKALLMAQAICMMAVSALVLVAAAAALRRDAQPSSWREMTRMLLGYGTVRAVIPFLDLVVLSLGPWLIRDDLKEAGYLVIALSLAQLVQIGIIPITQVSSVVGARLMGAGSDERVGDATRILLGASTLTALFSVAAVLPWSEPLIRLWLVDPVLSAGVSAYFRYIGIALVPLAVYYGVKGIIEVRWVTPFNLWSLLACVATQVGVYYALRGRVDPREAVSLGVAAGFCLLGVLSVLWIRSYTPSIQYWGAGRAFAGAAAVALLNVWASRLGLVALVPAMIASALIAASVVLVRPAPFARELMSLLIPPRQPRV